MNRTRLLLLLGTVALFFGLGLAASAVTADSVEFSNVDKQSREFMAMYERIQLSPEQEVIKKAALTQLPAPCCSDNTAYTCCCPCNLSRTIWGLSAHLIVDQGYDAEQVKSKVQEWMDFTTEDSHTGDACYTGGCGRPFAKGGCGGMRADQLQI